MEQSRQLQDYLEHYNDSNVDMIGIMLHVKTKWKLALSIVMFGTILSIAIALFIDKVYQVSVEVSKSTSADIVPLNENGYTEYKVEDVFKLYYDKARAKESFRTYVEKHQLLEKFFADKDDLQQKREIYFSELFNMFSAGLLSKNRNEEDNFLSKVNGFKLVLSAKDEALAAHVLNDYVVFVEKTILEQLHTQEKTLVAAKIAKLKADVGLLRHSAKTEREFEIARIKEENAQKLADLQLQKSQLIEKTKQDRLTDIANLEEANRLTIEKLNQRRQLTLIKAKQIRTTEIAKATEALKIAKSLGIVNPA